LGGVVYDCEAMFFCNFVYRVDVAWVAENIHRDYRFRFSRDLCFYVRRVNVEIRFLYIREDRDRAYRRNGFGGRKKSERRRDDFVACADAAGAQRQYYRIGPIRAPDHMLDPKVPPHVLLKFQYVLASGIYAEAHDFYNFRVDFSLQFVILSRQIHKGNGHFSSLP
jgi:hypothetical protein